MERGATIDFVCGLVLVVAVMAVFWLVGFL